ncbi:ribose transport system ATP-binding protein [Bacillus fengqiuensis]|nr:ribose transport system ATP-binding protein [Bacillus fengqiuensis]
MPYSINRNDSKLENTPILKITGISKEFPGVKALDHVQLELYGGEVHALMGENGAGKSTLMKILSGVYKPDAGTIEYKNQQVEWKSPLEAKMNGISVVHQELKLSPNLTIAENIYMGTDLPRNKLGMVKWKEVHEKASEVLQSIGSNLSSKILVSSLSVAEQQMVEIARALSFKAEVLIMDEPTATLTDKEIDKLFLLIDELKKQGVAIVYISHRMDEIFKISDRCTIFRDGQWVSSMPIHQTNPDHLVKLMVGREPKDIFQRKPNRNVSLKRNVPALEVKELSDRKVVKGVSFQVYPGEVVGLAGLVGAGRTELVRTIFGSSAQKTGEVWIHGEKVDISSHRDAIKNGISLVPESRKEQGLFLDMSVKENIAMTMLQKYQKSGVLNWKVIHQDAEDYIKKLGIKVSSPEQKVLNLSGGNQQKVVLAKWLLIQPKILLLDEPTRGVDIGAKAEIYKIIDELAKAGMAILMISSELPEILSVSDRVLVMHEGKIRADLSRDEASQEKIMYYATGEIA